VPPNSTASADLGGGEPLDIGSGNREWTVPATDDRPAWAVEVYGVGKDGERALVATGQQTLSRVSLPAP
jgi:hypothetical protein